MAESLQDYDINIDIGNEVKLYKKLSKLEKRLTRIQKKIHGASTRGAKYSFAGGGGFGGQVGKGIVQKQLQQEKIAAARIKQTMKQQTTGTGAPKASNTALAEQLRQQEKQLKQQEKFEKSQMRSIRNFMISNREIRKITVEQKKALVDKLRQVKTQEELNYQIKKERAKIMDAVHAEKLKTKEKKKQSFLQQRLNNSARQFAGNYVSAFAVAGAGVGATRVGQEFESVNNTMLAVSENAEAAGSNFQFVRDEAFRLGLGLKESAKGFAKMVAARGEMTIEETKEAFKGVAEMGTLLGLSAEENGRAINALMQIDGLAS